MSTHNLLDSALLFGYNRGEVIMADGADEKENKKDKEPLLPLILIVDDDVVMLRTMVNILKNDFRTRIAKSGASALQMITNEKPDLVLLDYMMPVANGVQTLGMMRSESTMQDIPVFFLTGVADSDVVAAAKSMKVDGYILKTTPPDEILKRVKAWFGIKS